MRFRQRWSACNRGCFFHGARCKDQTQGVGHVAYLGALQRAFAQQQAVKSRQVIVRHCRIQMVLKVVVHVMRKQQRAAQP